MQIQSNILFKILSGKTIDAGDVDTHCQLVSILSSILHCFSFQGTLHNQWNVHTVVLCKFQMIFVES
jgi:hypothetical protein